MDNAKGVIPTLKIIHKAICIGLLMFSAVMTYLVYSGSAVNVIGDAERTMQLVAVGLAAVAVILGEKLFKKKINALKEKSDTKARLDLFRQASIIQWGLIDAAGLFSIVGFFLTANYAFLALALCLAVYLILLAPTFAKASLITGMSAEELSSF